MNNSLHPNLNTTLRKLNNSEVKNYHNFFSEIIHELISNNYGNKFKILRAAGKFRKLCKKEFNHETIIESINDYNNTLIEQNIRTEKLLSKPLSEKDWELLENKYGIIELESGTAYFGNKARLIYAIMNGEILKESDLNNSDTDMLISKGINRKKIIEKYRCDGEGVKRINTLDTETTTAIIQNGTDCSGTQVIVTKDKILFSEGFKSARIDGIIEPGKGKVNVYGINFFEKDGEICYYGKLIFRLIKFIAEEKYLGFKIKEHNLTKENLETIKVDKYILSYFLYKLSQKQKSQQINVYWNFEQLLKKINYLENSNIFEYFEKNIHNYPIFMNKILKTSKQKTANRLMSKYINHEIYNIFGENKEIIESYKIEDKQNNEIIINKNWGGPTEEFKKEYFLFIENQKKGKFSQIFNKS